ncbi:MAG: ABC transporter ATP-binding protein [Chloroflexi bacterium]|nr:ABC transporter ATP-binding protein [Chloroflexota bacterium]
MSEKVKRLEGWRGVRAQLPYIPRALRLVYDASRGAMIAWFALLIMQSAIPVLVVVLTRDAINSVVTLVDGGWDAAELNTTVGAFLALAVVHLAAEVIGGAMGFVRLTQTERIRDTISRMIQEKAVSLDVHYFESQAFYDLIHRVRQDARMRPLSLLENVGLMLRTFLSLIGMIGLLIAYSPWLPFVLLIGGLPALWSIIYYSRKLSEFRLESAIQERRSIYYDTLVTERAAAQELRMFGLAGHYMQKYREVRRFLIDRRMRMARSKIVTDFLATLIGFSMVGGALIWMAGRALSGEATLGDLGAFYQIFRQGQGLFSSLMGSAGEIYQNMLFLEDLFTFFDLKPNLPEKEAQGSHPWLPLTTGIEIRSVSFSYPGSARQALQDFSLTIPAGKIIAIVGENGQGKTTLMKLLCRFYDPDEGCILWDGIDIRELPLGSLRRSIAMLFQVPIHYMETARQNIAVGDLAIADSQERIAKAAASSSADVIIDRLPEGYDTVLGRYFGGEELSVGQWQRLALARAFVREASLIILDEPTSAMDSWAENDWLARVRDHASARTMIMITHRFTTAMLADRIYLMRNSHIVEQGTHAELLELNGVYAQSWHEQMRRAAESPASAPAEMG